MLQPETCGKLYAEKEGTRRHSGLRVFHISACGIVAWTLYESISG